MIGKNDSVKLEISIDGIRMQCQQAVQEHADDMKKMINQECGRAISTFDYGAAVQSVLPDCIQRAVRRGIDRAFADVTSAVEIAMNRIAIDITSPRDIEAYVRSVLAPKIPDPIPGPPDPPRPARRTDYA